MDDAGLVDAIRAGDEDAWSTVYDRYADRIYDFASFVLRDSRAAGDAVQHAFVAASQAVDRLYDPGRLRPWLFSMARYVTLRIAAGDRTLDPSSSGEQFTPVDDLVTPWVWDATERLAPRDRAIVDLAIRQGFDDPGLADVLGVSTAEAHTRRRRVLADVERAIGAELVARGGMAACPALEDLVGADLEILSSRRRVRMERHVARCTTCVATGGRQVGAAGVLTSIPRRRAPEALRPYVLGRLEAGAAVPALMLVSEWGYPPPERLPSPAPRLAAFGLAVASILVLLGVAAVISALVGADDDRVTAGPSGPTPSSTSRAPDRSGLEGASTSSTAATTSSTSSSTTTTLTPTPPRLLVLTTRIDLGAQGTSASLEIRNDGAEGPLEFVASTAASWLDVKPRSGRVAPGRTVSLTVTLDRTSLPEGEHRRAVTIGAAGAGSGRTIVGLTMEREPAILSAGSDADTIGIEGCTTDRTVVTAAVADESEVEVTLIDGKDRTDARRTPMVKGEGTTYTATLGPYATPGTASWVVEAVDARRNTSFSEAGFVTVETC